jgi:thiosulfate dehydrogenase [quinone] large subunit
MDKEVGQVKTEDRMIHTTTADMPPIERLEPVHTRGLQAVVGVLRVAMGWTFLWAFIDKLFAFGFATGRLEDGTIDKAAAWIDGASPTAGLIGFGLTDRFAGFYQTITGFQMTDAGPTVDAWVDWAYMLAMLLMGVGLNTGVMTRLAAVGGIAWMAIFYTATAIWPEHNPFLDDHVVYAVILVGLILANAGRYYGLGKVWQRVPFVKDRVWLY